MNNTLAKKYNFGTLLSYALPNIIMMVFMSLYSIVDGMFISKFIGTTALSAVNMIFPAIYFELALSIMLATGGSAIIAKKLGEGDNHGARQNLTLLVIIEIVCGLLIAVFGNLFIDQIITVLGASDAQMQMCKDYLFIIFAFAPFSFLQVAFQTFFVTAGKPGLGLVVTIMAGVTNAILDYILIVPLNLGIQGAAIATAIGYCIPAIAGILYFLFYRKGYLYFVKPTMDVPMLAKACSNGSSEMVTNLSNAVTTFLFNFVFMKFYGEDGVASITIILYFQFLLTSIHFGYACGVAPIISFKFGCNDTGQLKRIYKSSMVLISVASVASYIVAVLIIEPVLNIFTTPDSNVFAITMEGFSIYAIGFLLMGVSIFASAHFTALSDGKVSAIISFARTFLFLIASILILPELGGKMGLWAAIPFAEFLGIIVSLYYLIRKKQKYAY